MVAIVVVIEPPTSSCEKSYKITVGVIKNLTQFVAEIRRRRALKKREAIPPGHKSKAFSRLLQHSVPVLEAGSANVQAFCQMFYHLFTKHRPKGAPEVPIIFVDLIQKPKLFSYVPRQ